MSVRAPEKKEGFASEFHNISSVALHEDGCFDAFTRSGNEMHVSDIISHMGLI